MIEFGLWCLGAYCAFIACAALFGLLYRLCEGIAYVCGAITAPLRRKPTMKPRAPVRFAPNAAVPDPFATAREGWDFGPDGRLKRR